MIVRYDMISVCHLGVKEHPQTHMRNLGYNFIKSIGEPMGDCWFFELDKRYDNLPSFLTESIYTFD